MTTTLATLQNLRTFTFDNHPTDLEEGQLAFNMAPENIDLAKNDANIYMYVGNGSNQRLDEGGTVLVAGGTDGKGWIRYRLRNFGPGGGTFYGNVTIVDGKLKLENDTGSSELIVPTEAIHTREWFGGRLRSLEYLDSEASVVGRYQVGQHQQGYDQQYRPRLGPSNGGSVVGSGRDRHDVHLRRSDRGSGIVGRGFERLSGYGSSARQRCGRQRLQRDRHYQLRFFLSPSHGS